MSHSPGKIPGMAHRAYLLALMVVIALGAYLRLVDLGDPSLWHDEIIHRITAESLAQQPWYRHLTGVREVLHGRTENGFVYYGLQMLGQRLAPELHDDAGTATSCSLHPWVSSRVTSGSSFSRISSVCGGASG